jgi:RNA polymerase sigma-70 factor (ECF subfamily)
MDDETILGRIRAGDRAAFANLVERYQEAVFRLVRNLLPQAECEDVAQEVFLAAFAHLASFDPARGASLRTWLLTIARNACLNAIKKRRPVLTDFSGPDAHPIDGRSPAEGLERAELFRRLDAALAGLPFEQRSAFVLAELEGMPLEEVGRVEGVPVGTVKSRLGRARERLRAALADLVERPR